MKIAKDLWDERYKINSYVYGKEPNSFLVESINFIPGKNILCVADGEGRNGVWLARQGFTVTSIDYSARGIKKAKKLARENEVKVTFRNADLLEVNLGVENYDGIVSIFSHFDAHDSQILHDKYIDSLKPGGVIIIEVFSKNQLNFNSGGPGSSDLLYNVKEFRNSFAGMNFLLLEEKQVSL
ncbi:MAG: class I SAM-dependent methyltransferase, partial [Candidatus Neomarinimicrobiota bacterium]